MTDIQKLKALAEALPRKSWETAHANQGGRGWEVKSGIDQIAADLTEARAAFIAAANPAAVLELIEEIELFRAMAAQPGSLNAMPSSDYDGLKRQFFALRNYALCKDKLAGYYSRELESLRSVDRSQSADEIDAERSINQQLTNDLLQVEGERDQLKAENEALRHKAEILRYFVGAACTCSTEIDARGYKWSEAYLDEALASAREAISKEVSHD
jgi:hypothetical protein